MGGTGGGAGGSSALPDTGFSMPSIEDEPSSCSEPNWNQFELSMSISVCAMEKKTGRIRVQIRMDGDVQVDSDWYRKKAVELVLTELRNATRRVKEANASPSGTRTRNGRGGEC